MRWNATTKTYCAVLVVAVGGLLVDRFAIGSGLSSPKAASAAMEALPVEPGPPAQALPVVKHVETAASRLGAVLGLKANADIEDAFGGDVKWLAAAATAPAATGKHERAAAEPEKPFAERHVLTGLSASRGGGGRAGACVWVDKVKVEVGQTVDGMKLVSVNAQRREATFSGAGGEVVLTLPRGSVSENARIQSSIPE